MKHYDKKEMSCVTPNFFGLFGTSPLQFAGPVPALCHNPNNYAIIASYSNKYATCNKVCFQNYPECNYDIISANDVDISDLTNILKEEGTNVSICPANSELFLQVLKSERTRAIFSACREGLHTTYIPMLNKLDKEMVVVCFDNDPSIVEKARELCTNPKITFCQAIIHVVSSSIKVDEEGKVILLDADKSIEIYFPPEALFLKHYFMTEGDSIFSSRAKLYFAETEEDFHFFYHTKVIDINGIHTLISLMAYKNGMEQGVSLTEIAEKTYDEFLAKEEALKIAGIAHSKMYDKILSFTKCDSTYIFEKSAHANKMNRFINKTYDTKDNIGRGVNWYKESSVKKVIRHLEYLKVIDDEEVYPYIQIANRLLNITNKQAI